MTDSTVALVRQAIFHVLDDKPGGWRFDDLNDDIANAERVDFADRVASWLPSPRPYAKDDAGEQVSHTDQTRNIAIEECARMVDEYNGQSETGDTLTMLAENMRALKGSSAAPAAPVNTEENNVGAKRHDISLAGQAINLTMKLLRQIARRSPEVLQYTDIEAFITMELEPAREMAEKDRWSCGSLMGLLAEARRTTSATRRMIRCKWVRETEWGYGKAMRVTESDHPRFVVGSRFDYGFLNIAVKEGFGIEIEPVSEELAAIIAADRRS